MGQQEVETADWGDERLDSRFELLLSALGSRPNRSIPAAWGGRAEMQAAYRFFDNDKVTFDKVLQPHLTRTVQRLAEQTVVLVVQDISEIDRTRPQQAVTGIADLTDARRGFLLHALQAFTCDGVPLGTVGAERVNRTDGISHACAAAKDHQKKHRPIEAKESFRWLTGLRRVRELAEQLPQVQCVGLADSEADIYEVFAEPPGAAQWLIRACQDRALQQAQPLLRPHVLTTPVLYQAELRIRGRKAMIVRRSSSRRNGKRCGWPCRRKSHRSGRRSWRPWSS